MTDKTPIYNPFKVLGLTFTKDEQLINDTYNELRTKLIIDGATGQQLFKLDVARQDCLVYAQNHDANDYFTDFENN